LRESISQKPQTLYLPQRLPINRLPCDQRAGGNHGERTKENQENGYDINIEGWGCSSMVENLPSIHKALGSIPNTRKKIRTPIKKLCKCKALVAHACNSGYLRGLWFQGQPGQIVLKTPYPK
jgi:hypothetical protein